MIPPGWELHFRPTKDYTRDPCIISDNIRKDRLPDFIRCFRTTLALPSTWRWTAQNAACTTVAEKDKVAVLWSLW